MPGILFVLVPGINSGYQVYLTRTIVDVLAWIGRESKLQCRTLRFAIGGHPFAKFATSVSAVHNSSCICIRSGARQAADEQQQQRRRSKQGWHPSERPCNSSASLMLSIWISLRMLCCLAAAQRRAVSSFLLCFHWDASTQRASVAWGHKMPKALSTTPALLCQFFSAGRRRDLDLLWSDCLGTALIKYERKPKDTVNTT